MVYYSYICIQVKLFVQITVWCCIYIITIYKTVVQMKIYPLHHRVTFHPSLSFFFLYPLNNVRKSPKKVYYILYLLCTGIEVDYKGTIAGIPCGPITRRCLLLCWTGYHPSQCEIWIQVLSSCLQARQASRCICACSCCM